eukprot:CAMPEP_0201715796 /NCGR_PEP_ID=MMETSP0593-20130828/1896_1 /ASSEMBLY_ACC=CAM_ASM_000672 /TAXON_ID=267983 /ORGANISM="Skeletonema japonicum, Strain CCMP2506" /LENGTH=492 /DNA_ID=CAMNT_0048205393 /DNA_START=56 /DNA_END=1534 /DNA_ORIENTATION=-
MINLHPSRCLGSSTLLLLFSFTITTAQNHDYDFNSQNERTYGLDISFPITTPHVSTNFDYLPHNNVEYSSPSHPNYVPVPQEFKDMALQRLGDRQDFYDHFMEGCRHHYAAHAAYCDETEEERLDMNYRQPSSMMNYTELGFTKVTAPKKVFAALQKFWQQNSGHGNEQPEDWDEGNTYTNHWDSPTFMLDIEDQLFTGGGSKLEKLIWDGSKKMLEEWTGQTLQPCSLYGIRKYTEGAVLAPHVDRLPLVTSAIINVAQDLDEPWPLEVYGHDGMAYNITMQPGEMILYESHSVVHGRPFPLKGRYYANVFIHFEPVGHSVDHGFDPEDETHMATIQDIKSGFNKGLPPYIIDGSLEAAVWRRENPDDWEHKHKYEADEEEGTGANGAHYASNIGDVETLTWIIENPQHRTDLIHEHDYNGWLPIHEAARNGHAEIVEVLVENGVDINERTDFGEGQSVLAVAYDFFEEEHPFIQFLLTMGAEDYDPEEEL